MSQPHFDAEKLSEYLEGELESAEAESLERHLAQCAQCREQLSEFRRMLKTLGRLPDVAPSAGFLTRLENRLEPRAGFMSRLGNLLTLTGLPFPARAGAVAVVLLAGTIFFWQLRAPIQEEEEYRRVISLAEQEKPPGKTEIILDGEGSPLDESKANRLKRIVSEETLRLGEEIGRDILKNAKESSPSLKELEQLRALGYLENLSKDGDGGVRKNLGLRVEQDRDISDSAVAQLNETQATETEFDKSNLLGAVLGEKVVREEHLWFEASPPAERRAGEEKDRESLSVLLRVPNPQQSAAALGKWFEERNWTHGEPQRGEEESFALWVWVPEEEVEVATRTLPAKAKPPASLRPERAPTESAIAQLLSSTTEDLRLSFNNLSPAPMSRSSRADDFFEPAAVVDEITVPGGYRRIEIVILPEATPTDNQRK